MRGLIVVVVVVLLLLLVGWLRFSSPGGNPTIEVDMSEVKEDTGEIVRRSKEVAHDVGDEIEERLKERDSSAVESEQPVESEQAVESEPPVDPVEPDSPAVPAEAPATVPREAAPANP